MSSSGFFTRSSMAQFDPVDFNCTTPRAALLPITVDPAGQRMKKQAQPFAAPVFWGTSLRLQSFLAWSAIFQFRYPFQRLLHYGAIVQLFCDRHGSRLLRG